MKGLGAPQGNVPKKQMWWRPKGERTRVYHIRMSPFLRKALAQRVKQTCWRFPDYPRFVLESQVGAVGEANLRAMYDSGATGGAGNKKKRKETPPEKRDSIHAEMEPKPERKQTEVYHFRWPLILAQSLKEKALKSDRRSPDYVRVDLEEHLETLDTAGVEAGPETPGNRPSQGEKPDAPAGGTQASGTIKDRKVSGAQESPEEMEFLRQTIKAAILHAEQTALHARRAFTESFAYVVVTHGEERVRAAIQGLAPPRYSEPDYDWKNWDGLFEWVRSQPDRAGLNKGRI